MFPPSAPECRYLGGEDGLRHRAIDFSQRQPHSTSQMYSLSQKPVVLNLLSLSSSMFCGVCMWHVFYVCDLGWF